MLHLKPTRKFAGAAWFLLQGLSPGEDAADGAQVFVTVGGPPAFAHQAPARVNTC